MITLKLFKDEDLSGYTFIEGLPGAGLVGPMTCSYLIQKLEMVYIGYIESNFFPPIVAVHDSIPMYPVRLYKNEKYKLVVLIAEFTVPINAISELADELLNFVRKYGLEQIISIGGMPSDKIEDKTYALTSNAKAKKAAVEAGLEIVTDGVVAGVSGLLLVRGAQFKISVTDILVLVNPQIMDPKYAENAIMSLKKLVDISINTDELEAESKELQAKVREMLKKAKSSHENLGAPENTTADQAGPSMYA